MSGPIDDPLAFLPDEALTWSEFILIAGRILELPPEQAAQAVLNRGLAESALAAPHAGFGGSALYPDPIARAAVLGIRICKNHSLVDGNKRVALIAMAVQLGRMGLQLTGTQTERATTIEALAAGTLDEAAFIAWVRTHTESRSGST